MAAKGKSKGRITAKRVQANEAKPPPIPVVELKPEIDNGAWDEEGLTVRQRLFVDAIVGEAGGNASRAAELAGYAAENRESLKATAARTLAYVNVRSAICRRLARGSITPAWIREMTAALARSSMDNFMELGEDGEPAINWRQAHRMGAFVQIRKYKEKGFKVDGKADIIERTIEIHPPAPYLSLLARILGMVADPSPGVTVNVTQMSEHDLVRIATRSDAGAGGNRITETATGE